MTRRKFLAASAATTCLASQIHAANERRCRVAVIGHTGRGNYGHGLDVVWRKIAGAELVGVADADPGGLKKALDRLKIDRGFSDYRKMLTEARPEFVSVAPRHPDQHRDMVLAAIAAGAKGLYVEKPFCRTPAEADELIAAAGKHGVKVAVAHRNRYHPALKVVQQLVAAGEIGRLLEIEGHGLGDRRGGGEDLWVLGGHVFNLMQFFGGDPLSCSATVLKDGQPATRQDVVEGNEGLGLLAGDEIHARWRLAGGVTASYTTYANDGSNKQAYAARLVGTKGAVSVHIDRDPVAWLYPGNPFDPASRSKERIPITSAGVGRTESRRELIASVHDHSLAIRDLIAAVDEDRDPLCDARQGATAVEMTCGVFESHRQGGAHVAFPLAERDNPLKKL